MRRTDELITQVRKHSFNEGNTATTGIQDENILQYLNDAQDRLQNLAASQGAYFDEVETEIDIVAKQRAYSIPGDALLDNRVTLVEYRSGSDTEDYYPLNRVEMRELSPVEVNYPCDYAIRSGQILLSPVPNTGTGAIRVSYTRRLDNLDVRRATISSHTDSGTQITALTLDTSDDDVEALDANTTLCVNDRDGNVTMYNLRYDSYDDTTGVVTITGAAFTYATGESITNGDYVTVGAYSTTHSDLKDTMERYLIKYAVRELVAIEDSSQDAVQLDQMLGAMEQEILDAMTPISNDLQQVPIINEFFR